MICELYGSKVNHRFPPAFQQAAYNCLASGYRAGSPVSQLPSEILLYVLNMCNWDHFGDDYADRTQVVETPRQMARRHPMHAQLLAMGLYEE